MTAFEQLIAATYTPLRADGELQLETIDAQAARLSDDGVTGVFVAGTTGEGISLTTDERLRLTERWVQVARGKLRVIAHVASDCTKDACGLARRSEALGVDAIAAIAPHYFRPGSVSLLLNTMEKIAGAAPATPFYYYDIPALTNVHLSMLEFLEQAAERIPTLRGLKYTNPDLFQFQRCLQAFADRYEFFFGIDEALLAALALGAKGAVGSTYNYAAPIYRNLICAFEAKDLPAARRYQQQSVQMVAVLLRHGMPAAGKAVMSMIGVDCGPVRAPLTALSPTQVADLQRDLTDIGFFSWIESR